MRPSLVATQRTTHFQTNFITLLVDLQELFQKTFHNFKTLRRSIPPCPARTSTRLPAAMMENTREQPQGGKQQRDIGIVNGYNYPHPCQGTYETAVRGGHEPVSPVWIQPVGQQAV